MEIGCLGKEPKSTGRVDNGGIAGRIKRLGPPEGGRGPRRHVEEVRQVDAREDPVVGRVLEDVAERHGGSGKAVDEERLVFALQEVKSREPAHEYLAECRRRKCAFKRRGKRKVRQRIIRRSRVDERADNVEHKRVDEERAQIFDNEDCAPTNLGTW